MRITCPNCDAQYEVPDDVIPTEGRDVQCSNCGQTWLQHHPDHVPADMVADPDPDVMPEPAPVEDVPAPDETFFETPPQPPAPPKRSIDPEVADILRQEAERERNAREQDAAPLETQPELGLSEAEDAAAERARVAQERMSRIRGEEPADPAPQTDVGNIGDAAATAAAVGARRELLPDIEEINSTLRSASDREIAGDDPDPAAPIVKRKKRGFRRGFLLALLLIVIAVLVYVFAPQIAAQVPQVDPWLSGYVAWVDNARLWLDSSVQDVLKWLDAQAAATQS